MRSASSIAELRSVVRQGPVQTTFLAQVEEIARKETSQGKPYFELRLRDGTGGLTLRAWSESPAFESCRALAAGCAVRIEGEFAFNGTYGLDSRRWCVEQLSEEEQKEFFAGGEKAHQKAADGLQEIQAKISTLRDPRLRALSEKFLNDFGSRFARAAAARANHHARRGGLLEHTLGMLRAAEALCQAYPTLHRDLLLAGVLFHDAGKLWEMCPPERGFEIPRDLRGELLGHISIGVEMVNMLWRALMLDEWKDCTPPSEDVRLHLLHLIASHHGKLEFGSPVEPKTPEAVALHHLDNLDAKLEMLRAAAEEQPEVAPGIYERVRALDVHPVRPLPPFNASPPSQTH